LKIRLRVVGKTRNPAMAVLISDYEKRIQRFCDIQTIVIRPEECGEEDHVVEKEGTRLLEKISDEDFLIALDRQGESFSSEQLEQFFSRRFDGGKREMDFIIGGPYGLSRAVKSRADKILSLSKLTFNHEMARLFLLEQIYRCFAIRNHLPYHK
jgi:23S rRNA (pseudouridine1915-N3)-methyltransferase